MSYERPGKARFVIDVADPAQSIQIKARKHVFALFFLPIWLAGWTVGGVAVMAQLARGFSAFLAFWLCGWALGWLAVAATLSWMLFGSETLRANGRDLEVGFKIGPWTRWKLYDGSQIRDLRAAVQTNTPFSNQWALPFMPGMKSGAIQFSYGARTVRAATGLDEPEGALIVEHLAKRLPPKVKADR